MTVYFGFRGVWCKTQGIREWLQGSLGILKKCMVVVSVSVC